MTMIARRAVLIALCMGIALAAVGAQAADPSARSFVESIYNQYKGKNAKGVELTGDATVRRYFEPGVAALIIKDRKQARREVGKLDADPFVDAQDFDIDAVDVAVRETGADKAKATVSFNNGKPRTVVLDLVKIKQDWRIADITWDRKASLRGVLTGK
jgi:uncharacterized protein DUF3828